MQYLHHARCFCLYSQKLELEISHTESIASAATKTMNKPWVLYQSRSV